MFKETCDEHTFQVYVSSINELAKNQYEPWSAEVSVFDDTLSGFHSIERECAGLYLKNINMLWDLGLKDFRVGLRRSDLHTEPKIEVI